MHAKMLSTVQKNIKNMNAYNLNIRKHCLCLKNENRILQGHFKTNL